MKLYIHSIAQDQVDGIAVGTVVRSALLGIIEEAIASFSFPANGQGFVGLPDAAKSFVTAGVGRRSKNPKDYVVREHRGEVGLYLRRDSVPRADLVPDGVAAIVYTAEAFMADPQTSDEEKAAFVSAGYTHCLVTVLAFKGPKPPVGPDRFVFNLAGGNARYATLTGDEIRAEAKEVAEYFTTWCVVG